MSVQADGNGELETVITIPQNVPTGARSVQVVGDQGNVGSATFVGSGEIQQQQLQQVTVQRVAQNTDPLAQTFTLPVGRQLMGVDIFFTAKGSAASRHKVVVQVRGVTVGIPNSEVLAEGIINYDEINLSPVATRCTWLPVSLEADTDYAIVVLTNDPDHELAIAELGRYDSSSKSWVAAQPYQIGVLLSSSNNKTWTPHQNADLKFNLLAAKYNPTPKTLQLGTTAAAGISDVLLLAGAERPTPDCDVQFDLTLDDGSVIQLSEGQGATLLSEYTGDVNVSCKLSGTQNHSPLLYQGIQTVPCSLGNEGTYVSRAIVCTEQSDLSVIFEQFAPTGSAVKVEYELDSDGNWLEVPFVTAESIGEGFAESVFKALNVSPAEHVRVKLTLSGTPAARPIVRALRVFVT